MHDPFVLETSFGWPETGSALATRASEQALRDRQEGRAAKWYHAALPPLPRRRAIQLGELDSGHPRQLGEFECGSDGG